MRNVINISLPDMLVAEVEKEVKTGGFASKSEFFRHLLRERRIARELERDQREFEKGKGKTLRSLRDLR